MPKEKPILFNTPMVQAILAERKTVTRRVVKLNGNPQWTGYIPHGTILYGSNNVPAAKSPYQRGDILWVRETWRVQAAHRFEADARIDFKAGGPLWKIQFANGKSDEAIRDDYDAFIAKWFKRNDWKPSIHMPREVARIFLRVTDVRVERLKNITTSQAIAEGAWCTENACPFSVVSANYPMAKTNAIAAYANLWDSTIKKADLARYGWIANPWVWVIEFERIEKPC